MSAENLCAMGKPGYSLENGELYAPRHPCTRQRVPGHIFCDECREEAGGYLRKRGNIPLRSKGRQSLTSILEPIA